MRFIRVDILDHIKRKVNADETIKEVVLTDDEWYRLKQVASFRGDYFRIARQPDIPLGVHPNPCMDIAIEDVVIRRETTCERYYR